MTPDQARALLDGASPAQDWHYRVKWGAVRNISPIDIIPGGELDVTEEDAALIVAAPEMAVMIAGMTVEYGVHWPATDDFPAWTSWGFDTIEKAREHNREMTVPPETPGTILRRYVTEPEEIK